MSGILAGIPAGCVEGFNFWDYVHLLHSKEEVNRLSSWTHSFHSKALRLIQRYEIYGLLLLQYSLSLRRT